MSDPVRDRFGATADRIAAREPSPELPDRVRRFASLAGDERALDAGTGVGPLALALAPHVREGVGLDLVPELLAHAPRRPSRPARSTWPGRCGRCTTSRGPSSWSPS